MTDNVKSNGGPLAKQSRARPRSDTRGEVDSQVRELVVHMTDGTFVLDEHGPAYAERWRVEMHVVGARAAQAARFLRMLSSPEEREMLRTRWLSRLDSVVMTGSDRNVASAAKVAAELAGLITNKHEVSAPPLMAMPPEEKKRRLLAAREAIEAELAKEGQSDG